MYFQVEILPALYHLLCKSPVTTTNSEIKPCLKATSNRKLYIKMMQELVVSSILVSLLS